MFIRQSVQLKFGKNTGSRWYWKWDKSMKEHARRTTQSKNDFIITKTKKGFYS